MRYFSQQHNFQRISCNFQHAHQCPAILWGRWSRGHGENSNMDWRKEHTSTGTAYEYDCSIRVRVYLHWFLICTMSPYQLHYSNKLREHVDIMIFIERYPLKRCQGCVKLITSKVNCFLNITDLSEVQFEWGVWIFMHNYACPHITARPESVHIPKMVLIMFLNFLWVVYISFGVTFCFIGMGKHHCQYFYLHQHSVEVSLIPFPVFTDANHCQGRVNLALIQIIIYLSHNLCVSRKLYLCKYLFFYKTISHLEKFICALSFSPLCDLNVNFTFNRAWNRCPVTETYWLIYAAAKAVINDHVGYYFQSLR